MTSINGFYNLANSLNQLKQSFKLADTDGDGGISLAEFEVAAKSNVGLNGDRGQNASVTFKKLDTNGNGSLTTAELTQGINLNSQVHAVLLQGQELMSGSAYMGLLGTGGQSTGSLFGSSNDFTSLTSSLLGGTSSSGLSLIGANASSSSTMLAGLFGGSIDTNLINNILAKYAPVDTTA